MFDIVRDEVEGSGWLHPHLEKLKLPFHSPFSIESKVEETTKPTAPHQFPPSVGPSSGETLQDKTPGLALPGTDLLYFDKLIPERLKARFFDIKVLYTQPLIDAITKKKNDPGDISMKLRYLGLDSDNAELYIVLQCEKKIAKRIRRFFAQAHVEEELLPDFRVLVLDKTLLCLSNDGVTQVYSGMVPEKTVCGLPIELSRGDRSVSCTLGGVIMVENRQKRLYGLIAGHALRTLQASLPMTEDSGYSSGDEYSDSDDDSVTTSDISSNPLDSDIEIQDDDHEQPIINIGTIVHDIFSIPERNNYDWALVELGQEYALPNIVTPNRQAQTSDPVDSQAEIQCYDPSSLETSITKQVILLRQGQSSKAELSFNTSSLMISPGSRFVDAYDIIMKDGSSLSPGDSGLWVIDAKTSRLYGHVVSMDAFGEAQVMPIHCTLQSIRKHLKATRHLFQIRCFFAGCSSGTIMMNQIGAWTAGRIRS
ncbi:uncharacterized protein B0J16DRAFT_391958 [Fusarium flagelliforme]|uniref:Uncharacterized protein n=1 Tax=Fusarium flagelliforme TaxID=2675880 RepID=A0A395MWC1_9HYPO|nr:uncharacterized protein B0J16DRAFT_391958 [Fusarium flagelliforme]KAH7198268.1 hypothetical protein B0J16DRAFT_391958 [Fusarium flagelliforme]RFN52216.1 hypothetical protein FIE12Z_3484 [Fusarium flagelliforme]